MTALTGIAIFTVAAALGLFTGWLLGIGARFEMMDDLEDADDEIERLRARG